MDFINQASGYAITGRSSTQQAEAPVPNPQAPAPPVPSPPTGKPGSCSDLQGWVYFFHNDKKKAHTCAEIAAKKAEKRAVICQSEQRSNDVGIGSPVSVSCKATCGVC